MSNIKNEIGLLFKRDWPYWLGYSILYVAGLLLLASLELEYGAVVVIVYSVICALGSAFYKTFFYKKTSTKV